MKTLRTRLGLTLIELLVVLTLMAFVAATATVTLSGRLSAASLGQGISLWEFTDSQIRQQARRKGRLVTVQIELGSGQFAITGDSDGNDKASIRSLGKGIKITRYLSQTRDANYGPLRIDYSSRGTTETFAIEIVGSREKRWLLFAGVTGQFTEFTDEKDVESILSLLSPAGVHAG